MIFINMTQPKTQQIKALKQSKLQLEIKKDSAQIELDRIDLQIKIIEVEIKKVELIIPNFVKDKI